MLRDLRRIVTEISSPAYVVKAKKTEEEVDGRVVTYVDKTSHIAEQYRILRTNLYSLTSEKGIKTMVITSSQSQEGKTTTSCNLAITLSWDKRKKILLIDGDMRRSAVHTMLNIEKKPGLSDLLTGKAGIDDVAAKPAIGDLYVIPAGSTITNPAELLGDPKLKTLVEEFKARFDYTIFDTPPTLSVADSSIIGSLCDGVILIVKAGSTPREIIKESKELLTNAQAKLTACVLANFTVPVYYYVKYQSYHDYLYKAKK